MATECISQGKNDYFEGYPELEEAKEHIEQEQFVQLIDKDMKHK
jgi:hypothetical protein